MSNPPAKIPLTIYQGSDFLDYFIWSVGVGCATPTPVDLTGATARMQARAVADSSDVRLDLTTENGGIVLNEVPGKVRYNIPHAVTSTLSWPDDTAYQLEITLSNGQRVRKAFGLITVSKDGVYD